MEPSLTYSLLTFVCKNVEKIQRLRTAFYYQADFQHNHEQTAGKPRFHMDTVFNVSKYNLKMLPYLIKLYQSDCCPKRQSVFFSNIKELLVIMLYISKLYYFLNFSDIYVKRWCRLWNRLLPECIICLTFSDITLKSDWSDNRLGDFFGAKVLPSVFEQF